MRSIVFTGLLNEPPMYVTYEADEIIVMEYTSFRIVKSRYCSLNLGQYDYNMLNIVLRNSPFEYIDTSDIITFNDFIRKYPEFKL